MNQNNQKSAEPTVSTRRIHEGRIINLREDTVEMPSGREAKREIVEHGGAVCIVPILPDGRIVLVRQYRKPAEDFLLEIPAGGLEPDESIEECAARELREECGYQPGKLTHLYDAFLAPGYSTELIHCFLAENLSEQRDAPDEDENVETEIYTLDELSAMIDDGRIKDAKTICALGVVYRKRKEQG